MWAATTRMWSLAGRNADVFSRDVDDLSSQAEKVQHLRLFQPVEYKATLSPRRQDASFAQRHEVLGDVCLAHVQQGFQMTDTGFPAANGKQDLHPRWLAERTEQLGD